MSESTTTIYANGIFINSATHPHTAAVYQSLQACGIPTNSETSLNQASQILLGDLGCGISAESKTFTLTSDAADTLDNENIFNKDMYDSLKPEELSTSDSFNDPDDPFYQLDNSIPDNYAEQAAENAAAAEPSYVTLAVSLSGRA